jgi:hypothetical protein
MRRPSDLSLVRRRPEPDPPQPETAKRDRRHLSPAALSATLGGVTGDYMNAIASSADPAQRERELIALVAGPPHRIVAHGPDGPVDVARFLRRVHGIARRLPECSQLLNLCDDRYRFLLGFAAALSRGITTLLPPSRATGVLTELLERHPGSGMLGDCALVEELAEVCHAGCLRLDECEEDADGEMPRIAPDFVAAIGFTSGSSGPPQAHAKLWGSFCASTAHR